MKRIDYRIPINNIEIWQLTNQTMVAHPFHIHDVQFYILSRNGLPPALEESGRKDIVLLAPGDTVRFITKFEDFADSLTPYMFHCHILMHEDDGMMGQFVVVPNNVGIKENKNETNLIRVYPNPSTNLVTIDFNVLEVNLISVFNSLGELVFQENNPNANSFQINTTKWSRGIYSIQVNTKDEILNKKIIIN